MRINCRINGEKKAFEVSPEESLLNLLRREGFVSVKKGCETGFCGSCTIILNSKLVNSCIVFALRADGAEIPTVEALGFPDKMHPIQEAFVDEGAVQCGYCTPGMLLATKVLLDKKSNPDEEEIKHALDGNLCRCTGYVKIIEAVKTASKQLGVKHE